MKSFIWGSSSTALWALLLTAAKTSARVPNEHFVLQSSGLRNLQNGPASNSTPAASNSTTTTMAGNDPLADPYPVNYKLWPPQQIKKTLYEWVSYFPDFVRLTTAQDAYGLPTAGEGGDCPYDDDVQGCKNYILTIQDFTRHPEGSDSSNQLPEVFLSGELHGNERVGPTAVMEAANLLLLAASCESKPRHLDSSQHSFNEKPSDWTAQLKAAKDCRKLLVEEHGMRDVHRKWLARLVSSRRVVIVPTANALGYFRNRREENNNDPNRDFPYDVQDPTACMKTIAGRTLNEIFREHMFQLSLTFHGGMEVVGYEWGAPTWLGHLSPDDTAQVVIGGAYSQYGGGFATSKPYKYGTMNDLVYFVRGGFEDWAYAGSWDPERVIPCQPETFDGYDAEKTKYNNSTLRVFNMLVETSNHKEPKQDTLGSSKDVFNAHTQGNGHVSRNLRLSLLAVDVVQPYVALTKVNDVKLTDDVIPMVVEEGRSCQANKAVMVPGNQEDVSLQWTVGGAFEIDSTEVWYAKWDGVPQDVLNCVEQPSKENLEKYFTKAALVGTTKGTGFFSKEGPVPVTDRDDKLDALGPIFQATMDVTKNFKTHDKIVVIASAKVDQSWQQQPANVEPKLPPQSHIVNARTNPSWRHESGGKIIQGRLDWYSMPLTVVVGDYQDNVGNQAGRPVGTVELSNRFGETTGDYHAGITPASSGSGGSSSPTGDDSGGGGFGVAKIVGLVLLLSCCCFLLYKRMSKKKRKGSPVPTYNDAYQDDEEEYGRPGNKAGGFSDKREVELNSY